MTYEPNPIDTSKIELTGDIEDLTEMLARNTHEVWAKQRMSQGWTYGRQRDDDERTHPGLVPYEDLSEQEKDYDRSTSVETLKAIVGLGYRITRG